MKTDAEMEGPLCKPGNTELCKGTEAEGQTGEPESAFLSHQGNRNRWTRAGRRLLVVRRGRGVLLLSLLHLHPSCKNQ